jgi:hypothetical protein
MRCLDRKRDRDKVGGEGKEEQSQGRKSRWDRSLVDYVARTYRSMY